MTSIKIPENMEKKTLGKLEIKILTMMKTLKKRMNMILPKMKNKATMIKKFRS
jgi:hypothetical protein